MKEKTKRKAKKRVRWTCTECLSAKNGPIKPRANATIRYCLECSSKSDILVERLCLSIEKARLAKKEQKNKKLEKKKVSNKKVFGGVDVIEEMKRQCKILCVKGIWPKRMRNGMKFIIRKSKYKKRARGLCYYSHITLTLGKDVENENLCELIFHELTHAACDRGVGHSDIFRAKLVEGARGLWGINIDQGPKKVYDLDWLIVKALKERGGDPAVPAGDSEADEKVSSAKAD